ncbi:MAG: tRNA pseudouridine(38-40) synthase TruA [Xanthomonadales bacterium]|mgnify:CR=1 FL=1|nr:tRNA pseudouridine(38-40) synthase TruA [Xanthomonadales bacterium]
MPRYALGVEYDGSDFLGWQIQPQEPTVQATLERALAFVAAEPVTVFCAGRTDTGVHALGQVVHFDCSAERAERAWILGCNSRLPDSVAVRWAQPVSEAFHARYSARRRSYRYRILRSPTRPALEARYVLWAREELNVEAMRMAAQALVGRHDFTSFRTLACQSKSPVREVYEIRLIEAGEHLDLHFEANAFLHHMIRNFVGSLLKVARGERPVEWVSEVLAARDRSKAGPTAAAHALTFMAARYPAEFALPAEHTL